MFRDDFTYAFDARGRHDIKSGAEFISVSRSDPELPELQPGD